MSEKNESKPDIDQEDDDYQTYLKEIAHLKSDFSDLEELDFEEIEAMQHAISQVKEGEEINDAQELVSENGSIDELEGLVEDEEISEVDQVLETKEEMMVDFSDIGKMDLNELMEMKKAVETVKREESISEGQPSTQKSSSSLSEDIEKRIQEELMEKKKEKEKKEVMTEDDFLKYIQNKRDKIWYHSLYYLAFEVEDHTASKSILYDQLKEDTSKSPIDPIPEHQFYFGLGYILRLKINQEQIVRYVTGGSFKINYDIKTIQNLLERSGEPIITKPKIEEDKKKKMFREFLSEDFSEF